MTLRRRFTFFTIFWLIFILILFNIFVYLFVIKITIRSEDQLLTNKVNILLEDKRINDPAQLANFDLLKDYYNVNELIESSTLMVKLSIHRDLIQSCLPCRLNLRLSMIRA